MLSAPLLELIAELAIRRWGLSLLLDLMYDY